MASQGYRDWVNAGRPYTLIRPAKAVQAALRGHGLTVYDYPNSAHLLANTPEDHTPFSVTGWPGTNKRWNARALDIMPRTDTAAGRKENADIARQLIRDRDAGVPGAMWIKYLNWTDEQGVCSQERWTDAGNPLKRTTRSSSDKGHVHVSGRSDVDNDDRADDYDPVARMNGDDDMTPEQAATLGRVDARLAVILYGMDSNPYGQGAMKNEPNQLKAQIAAIAKDVDQLKAAVAAGAGGAVGVGGLSDADVQRIAEAVADEEHRRSES